MPIWISILKIDSNQGIGLGLCQNIIEHHEGRLTLENNKTTLGATARVVLPTKASSRIDHKTNSAS